jgi:hypothetical protein
MLYWLLFLPLLTLACSSSSPRFQDTAAHSEVIPLLNIRDIAGQTQEDIATILGHQSQLDSLSAARSGCPTCQKYAYLNGLVKIVYINDMADWITITPLGQFPAHQAPILLGLIDMSPDFTDQKTLRWNHYEGIRMITAFKKPDGSLSHIYLRVTTP